MDTVPGAWVSDWPHGSFFHVLIHSFIPQHVLGASYEPGMALGTRDGKTDNLPEEDREGNKTCRQGWIRVSAEPEVVPHWR